MARPGAVRQRHHHRLQLLAKDLELADGLEFHGLAGQVFLRGHCVGENVQQQVAATGGVDTESYHISHHRLQRKKI